MAENISDALPPPPSYQTAISVTFGRNAVSMVCPYCYRQVVTRTSPKCGPITHFLTPAMFLLGCWLCFLIHLCLRSCKDIEHVCPNCGKILGIYHKGT
ncbi:unnamed protein product [Cylicocyclus nassatus]|uniref:LITAF domain-containing protein n=1 Tax=Cylicocyclus nassatus TaxID=53992 RepID=A0AA36GU03_CYLNA|nr:unnamed protein product [Cylicocyclus nassatus]